MILGILAVAVGAVLFIDWGNEAEIALQEELDLLRDAAQSYVAEQAQRAAAQNDGLSLLALYLWSVQKDLGSLVSLTPVDVCMPELPLQNDYFLRVIEALAVALGQEPPMGTREMLVALEEQEAWEGMDRYCGMSAAIQDTREEADDAAAD